eukprot:SAG11_NODE_7435_length_1144_cov_1.301435_1_plen_31_part_01
MDVSSLLLYTSTKFSTVYCLVRCIVASPVLV